MKSNENNRKKTNNNNNDNKDEKSLVYLEDIHIFSLANFLSRPIIVLSLESINNLQQITIRGIYLPLLNKPSDCCKDPIVIAFDNFHFVPLMFTRQNDDFNIIVKKDDKNTATICEYNQFDYHFENISKIGNNKRTLLTNEEYEQNNSFIIDEIAKKRKIRKQLI
jgi:hypothetical protein